MREAILRHILQQLGSLTVVSTLVIAVCQLQSDMTWNFIFRHIRLRQTEILIHREMGDILRLRQVVCLLIILQRFEGVILLHAAIALLHAYGEGVKALAMGGRDRQQGEGEYGE